MKRLFTLLLICTSLHLHAQDEGPVISFDGSRQKDFGGFILDMGTMLNAEALTLAPVLPSLSMLAPWQPTEPEFKLNPDAFRLDTNLTYMGGTSPTTTSHTSILSVLYPATGSGMKNWQGVSYKLNNGARINLYGQYNADGHKVHNPSAMPWQRKDFNAAFEMKSSNGNFGIKVEVHGGRGY